MEKEISSGTMLGIVLIALAAVIGLGFGVFSIAKGVANEGTVGVQDNLSAVSESSFDDYNDKIVTGTMVKSAVQNFSGKSVAILINTTAMDKCVVTYKEHTTMEVLKLTSSGFEKVQSVKYASDGSVTNDGGKIGGGEKITATKADTGVHYYINYNALLDISNLTTSTTGAKIKYKDGMYSSESVPFLLDNNGKVAFDYSTGGMSRTGNCEYLNATAKFDASLLKDETGQTIGVVFTQRVQ